MQRKKNQTIHWLLAIIVGGCVAPVEQLPAEQVSEPDPSEVWIIDDVIQQDDGGTWRSQIPVTMVGEGRHQPTRTPGCNTHGEADQCIECADAGPCADAKKACSDDHGCPAFMGCMFDCREACRDDGDCVSECVAGEGGCLDLILRPDAFQEYLGCLCDSCAEPWLGSPACRRHRR